MVNIITGFGDPCGKTLTSHKLVERVAFTGGPETAKHIIKNSAENLSQVSLELGGKSPVAVFEDADQESALNGITAGILVRVVKVVLQDLDYTYIKIFMTIF